VTDSVVGSLGQVGYPRETWGLRMRGSVIGFFEDSRNLFLGNNFRYALEGTVIIYVVPVQLEFSVMFDLGKTTNGYSAIGRYFTFLSRRNFVVLPETLRDMRVYLGAGIGALNYEREENGATFGVVIGGFAASSGLEVLLWRGMYMDLSVGLILPWQEVEGLDGFFNVNSAWLTSLNMGLGLGYRF
jgi:hypothetical protein